MSFENKFELLVSDLNACMMHCHKFNSISYKYYELLCGVQIRKVQDHSSQPSQISPILSRRRYFRESPGSHLEGIKDN